MSLYSKVLHVKDTGGTVYNIPLYTSSSDSDLNSHPAPIIMDGQTLYAPYCAEDDDFASPLHCKISGTTYRLQKQKLLTGKIILPNSGQITAGTAANAVIHANGGGNTIFKININIDFDDKVSFIMNHLAANWWTEAKHSDPFSLSFYVKISQFGVYRTLVTALGDTRNQSWDCYAEYSPEIEAYGLANGVSVTDLNPDYVYSNYKILTNTSVISGSQSFTAGNISWKLSSQAWGTFSFTVPTGVNVLHVTGTSFKSTDSYFNGDTTIDYLWYGELKDNNAADPGSGSGTTIITVNTSNLIIPGDSSGAKSVYVGVTPGVTYTWNAHNFSSITISYSDDINMQTPTVFDY